LKIGLPLTKISAKNNPSAGTVTDVGLGVVSSGKGIS
jgi:hypothetical protein